MTLWGTDTVKDVAESVGVSNLNKDVTSALCRDVEYRLSMVLEQAMKFMRHSQRTILWSQDITQALRVLDVEPLYGYESTRPLRYGEASIGPQQPLFYVEDEEMDFEKLINAPLPKVPREMSFTAHWLAVEGMQPTIPQNPTLSDTRQLDLLPKSAATATTTSTGATTTTAPTLTHSGALAAMSGLTDTTTRPQVKHILSKELQLYFEKVCTSILDESQPEYRTAGLSSLREDPGLHQLVPYFVQFIAEKVTHCLRDLFILTQMMEMTDALTRNEKLDLRPYVASLIPPVLTCLIGRNLRPYPSQLANGGMANGTGTTTGPHDHFILRTHAATLLAHLIKKYSKAAHHLKPRLARSCLKTFLDPRKSLGSHYGAILGFGAIGGGEVVRQLVVPNLKEYGEEVLRGPLEGVEGEIQTEDAERVLGAISKVLLTLVDDEAPRANGHMNGDAGGLRDKLVEKVGETIGTKIAEAGNLAVARAVLDS